MMEKEVVDRVLSLTVYGYHRVAPRASDNLVEMKLTVMGSVEAGSSKQYCGLFYKLHLAKFCSSAPTMALWSAPTVNRPA